MEPRDDNDWQPLYIIVWADETTRRRHLARVDAASGPYTLAQAHTVLDIAAAAQDAGTGRDYRAAIVPYGDPFGIGDPWDIEDGDGAA